MIRGTRLASGVIIAAPASGCGKTTVTLGLLRHFKNAGLAVSSAKVGPDYIDPQFHTLASGKICLNLDPWAMRPETISANVLAVARDTDLLIVEGVMGLFDGAANGTGSTADLAVRLGLPIVLVVDASSQSQSVAAVVHGFHTFRADVQISGVIFNHVGSSRHAAMLQTALEPLAIPVLGCIPRHSDIKLPERHLGLVQPAEHQNFGTFLENAADFVGRHLNRSAFLKMASPPTVMSEACGIAIRPLGKRIAVASDIAFTFAYPHVLQSWQQGGAEILPFSPLADEAPDVGADAVFLPGGYPELHAARLSSNQTFLTGLRAAAGRGAAVYGECGGYMVLGRGIEDSNGQRYAMTNLLPLETSFASRRLHLGYRRLELLADSPLGSAGARLKGHEFHYASVLDKTSGTSLASAWDAQGKSLGKVGLRQGSVMGSFLHLIDRSNLEGI